MTRWIPIFVVAIASVGCGGGKQQEAAAPTTESAALDGEAQAARGATLYADNCAGCHGSNGEGGDAPAVVGKDALPLDPPASAKYRKVQFRTALDVASWVVKNMPPKSPSSLKEADYWDIMAFDLKANGVVVAGKHVDAKTAADIKLH